MMLNPRRLAFAAALLFAQSAFSLDFDPIDKSILELQFALNSGQTSSVELVEFYLDRIKRFDQQGPTLNSMAHINPQALGDAAALDQERETSGPRGPLHGIPIVVKDNYHTVGMPTEAGSLALEGFMPDDDAELVRRLRSAGAILLGKTNMHEFAAGTESVGSAFGVTRNPYDPTRTPGGSSGGTGAAVAANFAVAGLGSDTCGSIRIPAAHNALVGLRGTQGSSSRAGIIPLSTTQDIGGPLAKSVTDLALLLDLTTGYDPEDPQTAVSIGKFSTGFTEALNPDALRGTRIGVVHDLVRASPEDDEVARVIDSAVAQMQALGAEVVQVQIPEMERLTVEVADGFLVIIQDFANDMNNYLASHPDAPVGSVQDIIDSGLVIETVQGHLQNSLNLQNDPPTLYLGELAKRNQLKSTLHSLMATQNLDALAYPTTRSKAALVGEVQPGNNCHLSAISGFPAITVPAGFTPDGLPVGIELLAQPWQDSALVGLAYSFEQATRHRHLPDSVGQ